MEPESSAEFSQYVIRVAFSSAAIPDLTTALYESQDAQKSLSAVCRAYDENTGLPSLALAGK